MAAEAYQRLVAQGQKTVGSPVFAEPRFKVIADILGVVPVVSAALGPVAGFPAGRLAASHFSVMVKDISQVMVAGPALVERALGRKLTKEALGGYRIHEKSGGGRCGGLHLKQTLSRRCGSF